MRKLKRSKARAAMTRAGYHKMNRRYNGNPSAFARNWRLYC